MPCQRGRPTKGKIPFKGTPTPPPLLGWLCRARRKDAMNELHLLLHISLPAPSEGMAERLCPPENSEGRWKEEEGVAAGA